MREVTSHAAQNDEHRRALALARAGRHEEALARIREHLLRCPADAEALNDAGAVLYELGRFDEAVEHLRKAAERFDTPPALVLANLAEACLAAGRAAETLALLDRLQQAGQLPADLPNRTAAALLDAGDCTAAVEAILISLRARPDQRRPWGLFAPAADEPRRRQRYQVLMELGDCYASVDQPDSARDCYLQAARLDPRRTGPHVGLGILALQDGDLPAAEAAFRAAADMDSRCAEAYGGLAMVLQQRQDFPAALDMYLRCLQLDADNLVALLGLFQTSCRMGTFAKVIHYLQVYLDRHPGDTSVLFCLATLYARDGRLADAEGALLDVLALEPDKLEAAELLAEVRADAAGAQLQQARQP